MRRAVTRTPLLAAALLALPLAGCLGGGGDDGDAVVHALGWRTIAVGAQSEIRAEREATTSSEAEWTALWREHVADAEALPPQVPRWDRERISGYFWGEKPDGCHAVTVTGVNLTKGGDALVDVVRKAPEPGAACTEVVTAPFVIVLHRKPDEGGTTRFRFLDRAG